MSNFDFTVGVVLCTQVMRSLSKRLYIRIGCLETRFEVLLSNFDFPVEVVK